MENLEDDLGYARDAVKALATNISSGVALELAAREVSRLIKDVERAVQYAQREAMGEPEPQKIITLGRLQQVERAVRELKAIFRKVLKSAAEGTLPTVSSAAAPPTHAEEVAFLLQRSSDSDGEGSSSRRGGGAFSYGRAVDVVGEWREVTQSLVRTRELMAQELRRMGGVVDVIEEDGTAITDTHEAHQELGGALYKADVLLKKLKRQEQLDKLSKRLGVGLFLSTLAFIIASSIVA